MSILTRLFKTPAAQPALAATAFTPEEFNGEMSLFDCMDKLMPLSDERLARIAAAGLPCSAEAADILAMRARMDGRRHARAVLEFGGRGCKGR